MLEYTEYTKMLIGLIAIVNPIGAIPIFISLTSNLETSERNAISRTVVYSVLIQSGFSNNSQVNSSSAPLSSSLYAS